MSLSPGPRPTQATKSILCWTKDKHKHFAAWYLQSCSSLTHPKSAFMTDCALPTFLLILFPLYDLAAHGTPFGDIYSGGAFSLAACMTLATGRELRELGKVHALAVNAAELSRFAVWPYIAWAVLGIVLCLVLFLAIPRPVTALPTGVAVLIAFGCAGCALLWGCMLYLQRTSRCRDLEDMAIHIAYQYSGATP